jgi:hypothetical protein
MSYKEKQSNLNPYLCISASAFLILLPSFFSGFFGDDYSWMLQAKLFDGNLFSHILSPAPYGYFRPVVKLFFLIWHGIFTDNVLPYRIFILILHIGCSLLVYRVFLKADFSKNVAWVSAVVFAVITCHSEALYSINSISEIFSAFFILIGIYYLLSEKKYYAIIFFTLALFSRESALCFLPITLVFLYRKKVKILSLDNAIILLSPVLLYFAVYFISHNIFEFVRYGSQDIFTLNPFSMGYKVIHYFVNMILPAKTILLALSYYFDGNIYANILTAIKDPINNLPTFLLIISGGILLFGGIYLLFRKILNTKEISFAMLLSLAALIIYLPMIPTAERFLYLPSIGICLLLSLICVSLWEKKSTYGIILFSIMILAYTISTNERAFYWNSAGSNTQIKLKSLHKAIEDIPNDKILIKNYDRLYYINEYTLPDMYMYIYNERKVFRFDVLNENDDPADFNTIYYVRGFMKPSD